MKDFNGNDLNIGDRVIFNNTDDEFLRAKILNFPNSKYVLVEVDMEDYFFNGNQYEVLGKRLILDSKKQKIHLTFDELPYVFVVRTLSKHNKLHLYTKDKSAVYYENVYDETKFTEECEWTVDGITWNSFYK